MKWALKIPTLSVPGPSDLLFSLLVMTKCFTLTYALSIFGVFVSDAPSNWPLWSSYFECSNIKTAFESWRTLLIGLQIYMLHWWSCLCNCDSLTSMFKSFMWCYLIHFFYLISRCKPSPAFLVTFAARLVIHLIQFRAPGCDNFGHMSN